MVAPPGAEDWETAAATWVLEFEHGADPGGFIIQACERAKAWLREALDNGEIDQIVEARSLAEVIRVYTMQKQLGKDAQLSATEVVRRAERGIGVAIRRGQESGEIRGPRTGALKIGSDDIRSNPRPVTDFVKNHELSGGGNQPGIYDLTDDVSDEDFEQALAQAKAEQNLTRANVARKVKAQNQKATGAGEDWIPGPGNANGEVP